MGIDEKGVNLKEKDWTGNKKSIFVTLGASNHANHKREKDDYYATEPKALSLFLDKLETDGIHLSENIWECACGEGHLSKELVKRGFNVLSTDLINRGFGNYDSVDFLTVPNVEIQYLDILTNPPYKYAQEFVEKALNIVSDGNKVIMFLKIQFLEGKKRFRLFRENNPKYVYVSTKRLKCAMNGNFQTIGSSASAYAWFVWEKGYNGETVVRWFNNE